MAVKEKVKIIVGFDGSCAQSEDAVKQQNETTFVVYPSRRNGISEEESGKGFRLGVELVNESDKDQKITLGIDWEEEDRKYMHLRDFVFVKKENEEEWQMVPASVRGSVSTVKFHLKPGTTQVYLNTRYNYADNEAFVASLRENKYVSVEKAGESEEKRNIWLVKIDNPDINPDGKTKVMIMARNHAYESAGNYCVEGMTDFLLSGDDLAEYFLSKFSFYFMPMTNPDGVYNGMSRLTSPKGADLNRIVTVPDKAHQAIKKTIDETKPALFLNIHNWMFKFQDGLLCLNANFAEKVKFYMPDQIEVFKKWRVETLDVYMKTNQKPFIPLPSRSWKDYCEEQFNAIGLCCEFPWFGRNGRTMKETGVGVKILKAVLMSSLNF